MTQLTEEQQERVKKIRERLANHREEVDKYRGLQWADGTSLRYYEAPDDVELLLSLLDSDSQAAEIPNSAVALDGSRYLIEQSGQFDAWWNEYQRPWLPDGVGGYTHAENAWTAAATAMHDKCVKKVKAVGQAHREMAEKLKGKAMGEMQLIRAEECDILAASLESLTLDQVEQEKQQ